MLTWAYRIGYAAAGLALVVISALIDRQVVHWAPIIGVHVAGLVGLLAFFDNLRLLRFKFQSYERDAARAKMYKPLVTALYSITQVRPVKLIDLGVSVFAIKRQLQSHSVVRSTQFVPKQIHQGVDANLGVGELGGERVTQPVHQRPCAIP
jgi:hypothetical protein